MLISVIFNLISSLSFRHKMNRKKRLFFKKNTLGTKLFRILILPISFAFSFVKSFCLIIDKEDQSSRPEVFSKKVLVKVCKMRCSVKKCSSKFCQNSLEIMCPEVSFSIKFPFVTCLFYQKQRQSCEKPI